MEQDRIFVKPVFTQEEIKRRVTELGAQISSDYREKNLFLIGILKGAYPFFADLSRAISLPLQVDFLMVSGHRIVSEMTQNIAGQDVLIVEDIVDSGQTSAALKKELQTHNPKSLRLCTLLDKPHRRREKVSIDYTGFTAPNKYVVGYGLDYKDKYRNLPYVAVLDQISEEEETLLYAP
jgi:hypoxanthine phosphoribosyltransferase